VQTIANAVRALSPLNAEAQEPLVQLVAAQIWRQRQAVAYIDQVGIAEVARSSSLLRDLTTVERSLLAGLRALALTPQAAADLGLTWARTSALDEGQYDPSLVSDAELKTFKRTLRKMRGEDWPAKCSAVGGGAHRSEGAWGQPEGPGRTYGTLGA
jgi:hypothetical protein